MAAWPAIIAVPCRIKQPIFETRQAFFSLDARLYLDLAERATVDVGREDKDNVIVGTDALVEQIDAVTEVGIVDRHDQRRPVFQEVHRADFAQIVQMARAAQPEPAFHLIVAVDLPYIFKPGRHSAILGKKLDRTALHAPCAFVRMSISLYPTTARRNQRLSKHFSGRHIAECPSVAFHQPLK